ncbi:EcsC protein family protein [Yoonia tamlensis]|uniref:EcsC protein family protein n=1 Tax=Yoonia tamlensis TaxID=390270 RepID=A0A1I6FS46_9RHOB|nr:EcsC family protein [Yoonia tamlensis]SFR32743.1 EcsC protein family protein [Yoonia tamlensis]
MTIPDDHALVAQTCQPLDAVASAELRALALRQRRARGILITAISYVGGQVEDSIKLLPKPVARQIDEITRKALLRSFDLAAKSRGGMGKSIGSDRVHRAMGTLTGALGGVGGLPTALAELPVATTVIFRAVLHVAETYGEDPQSVETRMQCLAVFGAGGPGSEDDGINTAFFGARLGLSGAAVQGLISKVAPKFAAVMSQKLATQTVPILGAAAGAGTNYAFVDYYVALAHVHFGLRKLARAHGETAVAEAFHAALADQT